MNRALTALAGTIAGSGQRCGWLIMLLLTQVCSCDYPEQGFFLLSGLDGQGKSIAQHVFEIEELVDDTDLTYGFVIHLYDSASKQALRLSFDNVPDFDRRGWLFAVSDSDYAQGDLALDLTHDDRMSFVGAWRAGRGTQVWPLAGRVGEPVDGVSLIQLQLPPPPTDERIKRWQVESLSREQAEARLGKLSSYRNVEAAAVSGLDPELGRRALSNQQMSDGQSPGASAAEKPRYSPPPLGGRGRP